MEFGRCKEEMRFGSSSYSQQPDTAPYSSPAAPIPYAYNIPVTSILTFFSPRVLLVLTSGQSANFFFIFVK
jgi:hypothetical protein